MLDAPDADLSLACQEAADAALSPSRSPGGGDPLSDVLGRRLRWLRVERGWSRKQVAAPLRVPVEYVEGHERGSRWMSPADLVAYARLFGVRISEFFKEPPAKGVA